ncbi:hypothetical protein GA0070616_2703 [Micromonospora nigra]|uniref:Uncharacterized protein n=1 Tax=Micromonospora nigra TaxID=145857 RepID=A0A1C6S1N6_9ACTN|nr:hypothetical protein GA0070616_2703 [Micromonospora nigra]
MVLGSVLGPVGGALGDSEGGALGDGTGDRLGEGTGEGLGDGTGWLPLGRGAGRGVGGRTGSRGSHRSAGAPAGGGTTGVRGPGSTGPGTGPVMGEVAPGVPGWPVTGGGITTGPTEGVGMNRVPLSGRAVRPTVAEPVLMAATMGIEAVPASSATVSR